jgi:hypothetical protein
LDNDDTVKLLRECDAGAKMAVESIDEVINHVTDQKLEQRLSESKERHSKLGNEIHSILSQDNAEDKEPNPIAKGMSWMKTNMKVAMEESDATVADLITDGCNMGVKSLNKYLNQYQAADYESKKICSELISEEKDLANDLKQYL